MTTTEYLASIGFAIEDGDSNDHEYNQALAEGYIVRPTEEEIN